MAFELAVIWEKRPQQRTSEAGPPNTKKISATPENIEDHGAHPPNFGDATT
jgi:hypothetical protein